MKKNQFDLISIGISKLGFWFTEWMVIDFEVNLSITVHFLNRNPIFNMPIDVRSSSFLRGYTLQFLTCNMFLHLSPEATESQRPGAAKGLACSGTLMLVGPIVMNVQGCSA